MLIYVLEKDLGNNLITERSEEDVFLICEGNIKFDIEVELNPLHSGSPFLRLIVNLTVDKYVATVKDHALNPFICTGNINDDDDLDLVRYNDALIKLNSKNTRAVHRYIAKHLITPTVGVRSNKTPNPYVTYNVKVNLKHGTLVRIFSLIKDNFKTDQQFNAKVEVLFSNKSLTPRELNLLLEENRITDKLLKYKNEILSSLINYEVGKHDENSISHIECDVNPSVHIYPSRLSLDTEAEWCSKNVNAIISTINKEESIDGIRDLVLMTHQYFLKGYSKYLDVMLSRKNKYYHYLNKVGEENSALRRLELRLHYNKVNFRNILNKAVKINDLHLDRRISYLLVFYKELIVLKERMRNVK